MPNRRVVFLGGNGHCAARVAAARKALADAAIDLADVPYPGFEGRPRAADLEAFLGAISDELTTADGRQTRCLVYATGIGGLIALSLRARGDLVDAPLLLQAPVLWGLERRLLPRLMRLRLAQAVAGRVLSSRAFQRRFVRRHFTKPPTPKMQAAFFEGYARCAAFTDLFTWFTPDRLRSLEERLAGRPAAQQYVRVWWGARDRVVTPQELKRTEEALGTKWPVSVFPDWGHYPMIDDPEGWARECARWAREA